MNILYSDPRDRRGTKQRQAMLSVLRGLGAGESPAKILEDARAEKAAADAALELAKKGTSRDAAGLPSWSAGGAEILPSDLPDNWTTQDAEAVTFSNVFASIFGIVNSGNVRGYLDLVNLGGANASERFAGWIWSRLYSRPGWPDNNLIAAINKQEADDGPRYFTTTYSWWQSGGGADDSPERRVEVMANPAVLGDCSARRWGACLADVAAQAVYWVKWATRNREESIKAAADRVAVAEGVLKGVEARVREEGQDPANLTKCLPGFKLDPVTNKCVVEQKSALPWILGGAAVIGAVLLLRRR